jgi:hypothetical protein
VHAVVSGAEMMCLYVNFANKEIRINNAFISQFKVTRQKDN